jgi:hypothetical protein
MLSGPHERVVDAAKDSGLDKRLLAELMQIAPEEINPVCTSCLSTLAFKVRQEGALRLIEGGAVPIAMRLLEHGNRICVTDGILVVMNLLLGTWGASGDDEGHERFGVFSEAGIDRGMRTVFGRRTADELQKRSIARALLLMYKNREIPKEYADVCEHVLELVTVESEFIGKSILEPLICVVGIAGVISLLFLLCIVVVVCVPVVVSCDMCFFVSVCV